jgi:hypothetical protein
VGIKIQTEEEVKESARKKFQEMMLRKTFAERWEPVASELQWVISGRPNAGEHDDILPDYCYNIFDLYKRTIFKGFSPVTEAINVKDEERAATCKTIEEAKQIMTIDWGKLGSMFAIGERSMMFFEKEAEHKLKEDGLLDLPPEKNQEIYEQMIGDGWLEKKMAELIEKVPGLKEKVAELEAMEPGKQLDELLEKSLKDLEDKMGKVVPKWQKMAGEWSPEAVTQFHAGAAKGSAVFLDKDGELRGETKLADTYSTLLIAWPEIEDMIKASPPKRMNDLWDWLAPFSYAGWIEIKDLDQLIGVCRPIKLKLKKSGAPRKIK